MSLFGGFIHVTAYHGISHQKFKNRVYLHQTYKELIQNLRMKIHGINGYVKHGFNSRICNWHGRQDAYRNYGFSRQSNVIRTRLAQHVV